MAAIAEKTRLDLVGNRQSHTDRSGVTTSYTLANPANEYASIDAQPVGYDLTGNVTIDEAGRTYAYDERNRLVEIRDSGSTVLLQRGKGVGGEKGSGILLDCFFALRVQCLHAQTTT